MSGAIGLCQNRLAWCQCAVGLSEMASLVCNIYPRVATQEDYLGRSWYTALLITGSLIKRVYEKIKTNKPELLRQNLISCIPWLLWGDALYSGAQCLELAKDWCQSHAWLATYTTCSSCTWVVTGGFAQTNLRAVTLRQELQIHFESHPVSMYWRQTNQLYHWSIKWPLDWEIWSDGRVPHTRLEDLCQLTKEAACCRSNKSL